GYRGGRGGGPGAASRPALWGRGPRSVREATGHLRGAHGPAADPGRVRRRGAGGTPLDPRGDRPRHLGARARRPAAGDQRGGSRPAGADRGRLGGGQRHPAAGPGARAAPRGQYLAAGIGWAWHARVTYGGPEPPTSKERAR